MVSFFKTFFGVGVKPKMFIRWPQKFTPEYFGAQRRLSDCMEPGSCGCKLSSNHHCSIAALYCCYGKFVMICCMVYAINSFAVCVYLPCSNVSSVSVSCSGAKGQQNITNWGPAAFSEAELSLREKQWQETKNQAT